MKTVLILVGLLVVGLVLGVGGMWIYSTQLASTDTQDSQSIAPVVDDGSVIMVESEVKTEPEVPVALPAEEVDPESTTPVVIVN